MGSKHAGSSLDGFLKEEGIYDECLENAKKMIDDENELEDIANTEWYKKREEWAKKHYIKTFLFKAWHTIIGNLFWRPINYIKNKGYKNVN
jgi:hypothetical protein